MGGRSSRSGFTGPAVVGVGAGGGAGSEASKGTTEPVVLGVGGTDSGDIETRESVKPDNREWLSRVDGYRVYSSTKAYDGDDIDEVEDGLLDDSWEDKLSSVDKARISLFTDREHWELNTFLRKGESFRGAPVTRHYKEAENRDAGYISDALKGYRLSDNTVFHRGSDDKLLGGVHTVEGIQKLAKKGTVVTDKGFTSATALRGQEKKGDIIYHIKTPAGKGRGAYLGRLANNPWGHEFLFDKESHYRIVGAYLDDNGKVNCNMEYIGKG